MHVIKCNNPELYCSIKYYFQWESAVSRGAWVPLPRCPLPLSPALYSLGWGVLGLCVCVCVCVCLFYCISIFFTYFLQTMHSLEDGMLRSEALKGSPQGTISYKERERAGCWGAGSGNGVQAITLCKSKQFSGGPQGRKKEEQRNAAYLR